MSTRAIGLSKEQARLLVEAFGMKEELKQQELFLNRGGGLSEVRVAMRALIAIAERGDVAAHVGAPFQDGRYWLCRVYADGHGPRQVQATTAHDAFLAATRLLFDLAQQRKVPA